MVLERNWLDVYPYTNWGGNSNLPVLQPGDTFQPSELLLQDVRPLNPFPNFFMPIRQLTRNIFSNQDVWPGTAVHPEYLLAARMVESMSGVPF